MDNQIAEKILSEVAGLKTYMDDKVEKVMIEVVNLKMYVIENMTTKDELRETEDKVTTHIDGFVKLHENLDTELAALRGKYERLEERIEVLERHIAVR